MAVSKRCYLGITLIIKIALMVSLVSCGSKQSTSATFTSVESTGGGETQSFSNVGLGTIQDVPLSSTNATLDFGTSQNNADYLLILNAPQQTSSSFSVQLSKTNPSALTTAALGLQNPPEQEEDYQEDAAGEFHQYLREMETVIAQSDDFQPVKPSQFAALQTDQSVGSVQTFHILSTLTSVGTCETTSGVLKYASSNLYVYVDKRDLDLVSDGDIKVLASDFENIAMPLERTLYGKESDINGDAHVSILLSEVVNKQAGTSGLVTGYFFPGDLYENTSSNPCSNAQEIFYGLVADPNGSFGTPISSSFVTKNILPGVLAHEYQHMISFNQHVFINGGSTEEPWLNEGLSHFTEDITGFGNENWARVKIALAQISKTSLVTSTSPNLAERGLCYLFLRYLYEQSSDGNTFIHKLYAANRTGVDNIEAAFAGTTSDFKTFSQFVNRFSLALALSETGLTSDSRYNFKTRTTSQTGNFTGFCSRCDTQDGRGTVLSGPVMTTVSNFPASAKVTSSATQFFRLSRPSGNIQVSTGSSGFTGALVRLDTK